MSVRDADMIPTSWPLTASFLAYGVKRLGDNWGLGLVFGGIDFWSNCFLWEFLCLSIHFNSL